MVVMLVEEVCQKDMCESDKADLVQHMTAMKFIPGGR